nr:GNAT family N-acetyltransferase [Desemzia sp. RIT 804]
MLIKDFRYHYSNGIVCERNNEIAGFIFGYKGEEEQKLDLSFKQLLAEKNYDKKIDLSFDKETRAGEWYIDMVFTQPNFRKQGVATELLESLPGIAKEAGEFLVALNCDLINDKARKVYEKQGFRKESEITIIGHHYAHMVKRIV